MTANEDFVDVQLRRAIFLEQFKGSESRRIQRLLLDMETDLETRLRRNLDSFKHGRGKEPSKRLVALLAFVRVKRTEQFGVISQEIEETLGDLSIEESGFQLRSAANTIPIVIDYVTPAPQTLRALVRSTEILGSSFPELMTSLAVNDVTRMTNAIRLGIAQGESTPDIVSRVLGTATNRGADGVTGLTRRHADAVVRTAVNAISNAARDEVWSANADLIEGLRWVATLDGRTSAICRARDGTMYPLNKGPRPPAHYRCRSVMVAVFDPENIVSARPFVRDTRTREVRELNFRQEAKNQAGDTWKRMTSSQRTAATRARRTQWGIENIGMAPEGSTYQVWLGRQRATFQDEVLGPSRGKLFRQGDLTLDRFVDRNTGREFPLSELRRRESEAWQKAGLGE